MNFLLISCLYSYYYTSPKLCQLIQLSNNFFLYKYSVLSYFLASSRQPVQAGKTFHFRITGPFVSGIHRWPVDSPHKSPVKWKAFQCHHVDLHVGTILVWRWRCRWHRWVWRALQTAPYRCLSPLPTRGTRTPCTSPACSSPRRT